MKGVRRDVLHEYGATLSGPLATGKRCAMKPLRRDSGSGYLLLSFTLALLTIPSAIGRAAEKPPAPDYATIIHDFRNSIPKLMREQQVPGLALAVVSDRDILWMESFGFTADHQQIAITPDTLFSVQSVSKNFTAAAVLIAVQEHLLDLDRPIHEYMPGFRVNSRFEEHPERKMTLRLLLSHRAGFTHEAPVGNNYDGDSASFARHIQSISQTWLRFPVGQRYSYSNLGIDLAGYILELRSGMPFHRYAKQKLLDPVGMAASSFDMEFIKGSTKRALGHGMLPQPVEVPMIPSGGLYTNAREWARYVQFHLRRGQIEGGALLQEHLLEPMYEIPFRLPQQTSGYGLGLGVYFRSKHQAIALDHGGGGFGFLSKMIWYPKFGLGIVLLTNSADHLFQNTLPNQILDRFLAAGPGRAEAKRAEGPDPVTDYFDMPPARQRMLAGEYLFNRSGHMVLTFQEGRLGIERGGDFLPIRWVAEDEGFVLLDGTRVYYRFVRKRAGLSSCLVRLNDGEFLDYNVGADDVSGPDKPEWDRYTGKYRFRIFGQPSGSVRVHKRNGCLFLDTMVDDMKLEEYRPGLFFTAHGEALDLRGAVPTWRNISLEMIRIPPALQASLVVCALIFLSAVLVWPVAFLVQRIPARMRSGIPKSKMPWAARFLGGILAAWDGVLIGALLTSASFLIGAGIDPMVRLPQPVRIGLVVGEAISLLALALPLFVALAWKRRCWTRWEQLHYFLVTLAALFVLGVLLHWKLLKWPF